MANGGRIDWTLGFKLDKTGLEQTKAELQKLSNMSKEELFKINPNLSSINQADLRLKEIKATVASVQGAFKNAFDTTTGVTNINKLSQSIKNIGIDKIATDFKDMGVVGVQTFNNMSKQLMTTNLNFKNTNGLLDKMGQTLTNTIKWNISSSLVNRFTGSIQQAYGYVQHLDTSLNDIRIVTGKSAEEMDKFAVKANNVAKALGQSTTAYTEAALIYYQQGLSDEESQARAEVTLKAANVTGQTGREVSEQLTAVWNGYKVTADEAEEYVDKLAAVAATTASDLEELSTGMSKVASAANAMGVDVDQLNAQLATIVSVTRQAPESVGTALKTIYARLTDLKLGESDEDGMNLGQVSGTLEKVGIAVLDANGDLKEMGDVMEEVAQKWNTWTEAQQVAIAQVMAGKRQYNNLIALFENWDMYSSALETSRNSVGTLQEQQDIYMESTAAHLQSLKTEWEDFYDSLISTDDINKVLDLLTAGLDHFTDFIDSVGGGKGVLLGFGAIATQVFGNTLNKEIANIAMNFVNARQDAQALANEITNLQNLQGATQGTNAYNAITSLKSKAQGYYSIMSKEDIQAVDEMIVKIADMFGLQDELEARTKELTQEYARQSEEEEKNIQKQRDQVAEINKKIQAEENYVKMLASEQVSAKTSTSKGGQTKEGAPGVAVQNIDIRQGNTQAGTQAYEFAEKQLSKDGEVLQLIEEINVETEKVIKKNGKMSQSYQDLLARAKQAFKGVGLDNYVKKIENLERSLEKLSKGQKANPKTSLNNLNKNLDNDVKEARKNIKEHKRELENLNKQYDIETEKLNKNTEAHTKNNEKREEDIKKTKEEAEEKGAQARQAQTNMEEDVFGKLDIQKTISGVTTLASGLTSVTFAAQSFSSALDAIGDSSLSAHEKISRVTMAIGMATPMLINGVSQLYKGLMILSPSILATVGSLLGLTTAEGAATAKGAAMMGVNAGVTVTEKELTLAIIARTIAQKLSIPVIGAVIVALTALTVIIFKNVQAHKEELKAIQESNQAKAEANQKRIDELKSYKETADAMKKLVEQYKEGTVSEEEFNSKKNELLGTLDKEGRLALSAADNWKEAEQALSDYQNRLAKETGKQLNEQANANIESGLIDAAKGGGYFNTQTRTFKTNVFSSLTNKEFWNRNLINSINPTAAPYNIIAGKVEDRFQNKNLEQIVGKYMSDAGADLSKAVSKDILGDYQISLNANDKQTVVAFVEAVNKAIDEGYELDENITKQVSELKTSEAYKNAKQEMEEAKLEKEKEIGYSREVGFSQAETIEEGLVAAQRFKDILIETEGYTFEEANEAWVNYLSGLGTDFSTEMIGAQTDFDRMTSAFANKYQGEFEKSNYFDFVNNIQKKLEELDLSEGIHLFTEEEWQQMILSGDEDSIIKAVSNKLKENFQAGFEDFKNNAGTYEDSFQSLIEEAISGKVATDDKSVYAGLKSNVEDLLQYYPELSEQVKIFNNEALIGTQQWTDAVYTLKDAFNDLNIRQLTDNYAEQLEKIRRQNSQIGQEAIHTTEERDGQLKTETIIVEADPEKFTEQIEDLMDADYAINVEVHADTEDSFNNLVNSMENMDDMASKIGEDFVVSAENITEIAAAYPGILEGYTDLGNGTIQLNKEIAQSAIDAASQAEIASTKDLVNEIENTNKKLELKRHHYKTVIDLATNATDEEIKNGEFQTKAQKEFDEIEKINNELVKQEEVDNNKTVAEDSSVNAQAVSENWEDAFANQEQAAIKAAQTAIEAAEQVRIASEGGKATVPTAKIQGHSTWTGNTGKQSNIDTSKELEGVDSSSTKDEVAEYRKRIIESAQKNYDALGKEIAANSAMAVEAAARLGKSVDTNVNVGKAKDDKSKSSSKKAKEEKHLEREADIYREINSELDEIESTLGRIQNMNSHKWGKDLQEGLKRENKLLDQQLEKLRQKSKMQQQDLGRRRSELESQGFTFNETGSAITNAEAKLDSLYAEYNQMVDNYNGMSADQQETFKKSLDKKKDDIDKIEKSLENYESLFSDYQSTLDEILDKHYEDIENAVNRFNNMVDVHLELKDAEKEWNDFWSEVVEDVAGTDLEAFSQAITNSIKQLKTLTGLGKNTSQSTIGTLINHLSETTAEVNAQIASAKTGGDASIFGDDSKLSMETLTNYRDQLMQAVRDAKEQVDNIAENYLNTLQEAQNLIDKQVEGWESISKHLEHNVELIKLIDGETAYDAIDNQYQQIYNNDLELLDTNKRGQDFWKEEIDRYEKLLAATEKGTKQWQTYQKGLEESTENYRKAVDSLDSSLETALKHLQEWRENQVNESLEQLDNAMSGGLGLDLVERQWKMIDEHSSKYLDNVERAYSMEEYALDLKDAANAVGLSAENQAKLNAFRDEELKKLNEKTKLTQYDIDESRARLEIMKQEMALEDARQNKSNMRLRRDSQGNYTYQYTADEEAEDEGERGLLTAKKEWYDLVKSRYKETRDYIIELQKEQASLQKEIADAEAAGDVERLNYLKEMYNQNAQDIIDAYAEAEKNKRDLYNGTAQYFAEVENAAILPQSKATISELVDSWVGGGKDSFLGAVQEGIESLDRIQEEYNAKTQKILDAAGVKYNDLKEKGIDPTTDSLKELVDSNEEFQGKLDEVNNNLNEQEKLLRQAENAFNDLKIAAADAIAAANEALKTLAHTAIETGQAVASAAASAAAAAATFSNPSSYSGGSNSGGDGSPSNEPQKAKVYKQYGGSGTQGPDGTYNYYLSTGGKQTGQYVRAKNDADAQRQFEDLYKKKYSWYDSGGYTGDWNTGIPGTENGRLAVLHQKELVLNESDTANLLKAVSILRTAISSLNTGGIANSVLSSANSWRNNLMNLPSAGSLTNGGGAISQDNSNTNKTMIVNADFSGVRSADAIYEALVELEGYGMQNAYSTAPYANTSY